MKTDFLLASAMLLNSVIMQLPPSVGSNRSQTEPLEHILDCVAAAVEVASSRTLCGVVHARTVSRTLCCAQDEG